MKCILSKPLGLLKLMLNLFPINNIQERKLNLGHFSLRSDADEPISLKLSMMLHISKLYDFIPI